MLLSLSAATSWASVVVVGTEAEGDGGYGVGKSLDETYHLIIAQQFTLTATTPLESITVYVNGDGTANPQDAFDFYLTDAIGASATAANVLASGTGTFPNSLNGEHGPVTFATPITLSAGSYFITLTSAEGQGSGWGRTPRQSPPSAARLAIAMSASPMARRRVTTRTLIR
ncbi:MAG: hypothetical protein QM754_08425 [Tepidisphaeraceae bacterium]